ncbi:hypothetical protein E0H89_00675 [Acinetobacter sp. ANC 3781]|uniref:hypothetical protein n=1 Tax=Acinetobacter sp. ANC 3781 TaxID=2529835 RepID=UPI00103C2DB0|nr:hypothetical protein [Acinetobacter sp. ANC 3781]TCB80177.1 hypothetical protein E0H89_00675 [Acinetobacter sp. ANC 3781]
MMDIQKEREAFEQHLTDTGLVEFAGYGFAVDECDEYLHEPTQVAWDSWLIGLNRTKAQAVPEGFVLVRKEPSEQLLSKAIRKYLQVSDLSIITSRMTHLYELMIQEAMIETQEQKG